MRNEPPQTGDFEVRYSEYKKVDGVLLPHLVSTGERQRQRRIHDRGVQAEPAAQAGAFAKKGRRLPGMADDCCCWPHPCISSPSLHARMTIRPVRPRSTSPFSIRPARR